MVDINRQMLSDQNAFSNTDKETVESFTKDFEQYNKEQEIVESLKKKPLTESQIEDFLTRGKSEFDSATMQSKYRGLLDSLRKEGLIIPDTALTFEEFKKKFPDINIIKSSWLDQMTRSEFSAFKTQGAFRVFQDIQGRVLHYQYSENGLRWKNTGSGMTVITRNIRNVTNDPQKRKELLNERIAYYKKSRKEIGKFLESLGLVPKEKDRVFNGQGGFKSIEAKEMANKGPNVHLRGVSDVFSTANKSKIMQKRK